MINETTIIDEYLLDEEFSKTNANHNRAYSGLKTHVVDKIFKNDACKYFGEFGDLHKKGIFYLHNLDAGRYGIYCSGHSFETLLIKGLINPVGISSKPAKHFETALDHLVNASYMFTQEFAGAQAWRDIDILLAPYAAHDKLSYEEVRQDVQRFIWNISFPLRSGFQSMFLNLTFGLRPSTYYKNKLIIHPVWSKTKLNYEDFQEEIDMINKAFLEIMTEGSDGFPFTFPLPTYNITKDFKWNSEVSDLIFELSAKWGTPYFSNYLNTEFNEEDALSLCCRLRLNTKEVQKVSGGIWNFGNDTGSLAVCTLNMAQLGYLTKGNETTFYNRLDSILEKAKQYLLFKKKLIMEGIGLGLYPMVKNYIGSKIENTYFLTIGINGLNEGSVNFCGLDIVENTDWCEDVLHHINSKTLQFQRETGQLINFESTPGEGCSHALAMNDKQQYPDIFTQGEGDALYYTGSSLIPHSHPLSNFMNDSVKHQERMQKWYTGGSVLHLDYGNHISNDPNYVKHIIKNTFEKTTLPYLTWSPTYGVCKEHGQTYGANPCCDKSVVLSRIVGYIRPVSRWNKGKLAEFKEKKFMR